MRTQVPIVCLWRVNSAVLFRKFSKRAEARLMLSALMTVYDRENPAYFRESLHSVGEQTLPPDEVVLVKDGSLTPALEQVIADFSSQIPLVVVAMPKIGRSRALRAGVEACRGDLVAIMDSDDICLPHRFLIQTQAMRSHPEVDVVGGAISEFLTDPDRPIAVRRLPRNHDLIAAYAKRRSPVNQMTVMFRRKAVLRAGNYRNAPGFEDWHLWNRMLLAGSRFMNLDDILVMARIGNGMIGRRAGWGYIKNELAFHRDMYKARFFSPVETLASLVLRVPVRLAPVPVTRMVYRKLLRSSA